MLHSSSAEPCHVPTQNSNRHCSVAAMLEHHQDSDEGPTGTCCAKIPLDPVRGYIC